MSIQTWMILCFSGTTNVLFEKKKLKHLALYLQGHVLQLQLIIHGISNIVTLIALDVFVLF